MIDIEEVDMEGGEKEELLPKHFIEGLYIFIDTYY
jgi:hypothetical protein